MSTFLRRLLPHGLIIARRRYCQLRYFGMSAPKAARLAVEGSTAGRLKRSNLALLVDQGLNKIEYAVDVGANCGDWTADLLHFMSPSKLLVIEPNIELSHELQARFAGETVVEIHHCALGDNDGTLDFHVMAKSDMSSLLKPTSRAAEVYGEAAVIKETVRVPVRTLDSLTVTLQRIDLLKIDVQGYEKMVIRGAPETLQKTRAVLLEVNFVSHYEDDQTFADLDKLMNQHQFFLANYSAPHRGGGAQVFWADALYLNGQYFKA